MPLEIVEQVYAVFANRWSDEDLGKCSCFAAPGFEYSRSWEFEDEQVPGLVHWFTFWLTFGGPNELYVYNCRYEQTGKWDEPPEGERDWGEDYPPEFE